MGGYVAPIVDRQRGVVLVLYNRRFVETWLIKSIDDGQTWSEPRNLTGEMNVIKNFFYYLTAWQFDDFFRDGVWLCIQYGSLRLCINMGH